jgi:GNAT superfamily N-acetyltransferase
MSLKLTLRIDDGTESVLIFQGDVLTHDEDTLEDITVGYVEALIVRPYGGGNICDELDELAMDDIYVAVYKPDEKAEYSDAIYETFEGDFPIGPNTLVVSRLEIAEQYRGKGYGATAVRELIRAFCDYGCDIVSVRPFPLQWSGKFDSNPKQAQIDLEKVRGFWEQLGFVRVEGTEVYVAQPDVVTGVKPAGTRTRRVQ